ncbi:homeobox protein Crxos-like, partial [Arvicanthis niloticus]|uniref:homeobox protein Crxos-like n=2 Tax=Arvicanthis niloticus TaxID=61156 RepID=UPI00403C9F19
LSTLHSHDTDFLTHFSLSVLASYTLGPLDQKYSWEQLWQLEQHFKMEPYPDLQARKIMATRLKLKEEQVEAWFIERSLEQEMRPPLARLQPSARDDTSSPSHKALCCHQPSWKYRLLPINPPECSTSCKHSC